MKNFLWKTYDYVKDGIDLFQEFQTDPYVFFLDSSLQDSLTGRYSFIGFDPFEIYSAKDANTLDQLKLKFQKYRYESQCDLTPLSAGIVGCLGYDEGTNSFFGFYDCVITIDRLLKKVHIASSGLPEMERDLRMLKAISRLNDIAQRVERVLNNEEVSEDREFFQDDNGEEVTLKSNFTKEQYFQAVTKAKEYIAEGEIYQVNLAQRFFCDYDETLPPPAHIYEILRTQSPSSFGCYMACDNYTVISHSPERFLTLKDGVVQTKPMKGTRARGKTEEEDVVFKEELLCSEKDIAELLMITDLERNDIGRVCQYGSVEVRDLRSIETYQTVFQATSTVEGQLSQEKDAFDLLKACFPGGSITGCPKLRAMDIIKELEPDRRGLYTGSCGYICFEGSMDFNILIRTMFAQNNQIHFHVGGGIVADSIAENEYQETLDKARAMCWCLKTAFDDKRVVSSNKA